MLKSVESFAGPLHHPRAAGLKCFLTACSRFCKDFRPFENRCGRKCSPIQYLNIKNKWPIENQLIININKIMFLTKY